MKEDIVLYAGTTWFTEFSRTFDGFVSSGPKLPKVAINLAINSRGILVFQKKNTQALPLLGLDFSQMKKVESIRFVFQICMITETGTVNSRPCGHLDPDNTDSN